jgi:glycosyltransferase involved in cell wall biosynthesis
MWVGDGSLRPAFERRIAEMNLKDRFILTGLVPPSRVPELTNAMDIVVHPSRRKAWPARSCRASLRDARHRLRHRRQPRRARSRARRAYALPPFDQKQLAEKLAMLLEDRTKRRAMGEAGRTFALSRFDAKVMVDGLERVYEDALAGAASRAPTGT